MKKIILDMFSSNEGVSHKRVISVFAVICIGVYAFMYKSMRSIEALEYIAIAYGLGTVVEKFTNSGNKKGLKTD